MPRLIMTLLAVVLLLSGGSYLIGPLPFEDQAARAVRTWRTSGAAEIWRDGFVPVGDLSAMSPDVLRKIQHDEEYGWVVAGRLPAAPPGARIRWDDGFTTRVPVVGPREAMMALSPWSEGETFPDDEAYHLTGAVYTTMRLRTPRGMATVPAWRLYFSDLPGPIDQVAVDRDAVGTIAGAIGRHASGGDGVSDYKVVDERTLLVDYEYGSCGGGPLAVTPRSSEWPDVVVLGLDVPYQGTGWCSGTGQSGQGVVRLDEPLGNRVVLDAASRLPVLCDHAPDACHDRRD
ncbi:hypothetical protein HTZ77_05000 [Nonomuraea sp. SMC257]|uniref:Uncharacterized protein n=1 Tax=Nonomuraea montanisoli TaxID=2741721 RepID=A0A7Y6I317_9ACTN|nr:hypothetical protein [Nonomuraea montanisoli]NUW30778.1 hypothetical protein [Nonomuraea montanisoli]